MRLVLSRFLTEEVDDVRQLEERTNLIRFGTNAEGIVDDWNYNANSASPVFAESEAIGTSSGQQLRSQNRSALRFKRSGQGSVEKRLQSMF
jgi:hypothetical protein